jgi:hypothetical protein
MNHTPGNWNWHDAFGRVNGKGEPTGIGIGITGDAPKVGSCSRFSFAVTDDEGFVVAHCTNALITMSSDRSEANARLMAAAPALLSALRMVLDETNAGMWDCLPIDLARDAIERAGG